MSDRTSRRRRRSQNEWSMIVERFAGSGLDARAFCAREHIGYATFRRWRLKLRDLAPTTSVTPAPSISSTTPFLDLGAMGSAGSAGLEVELELGGAVVLRLKRG
jgi:hypothetical protein